MTLILMAALQAAASAAPADVVRTDFDLADIRRADEEGWIFDRSRGCSRQDPDEIIVCGRRPSGGNYPMDEMARFFTQRPIVAEMALSDSVTGRAFVESVGMDRGAVSNRVMVGIKLPF